MMYDDLVGVPYVAKGRSMAGLDCAGLVMEVYRRLGIIIGDPSVDPAAYAVAAAVIDEVSRSRDWTRIPEPEVSCIVVIQQHPAFIQHLGVYVGGGLFLHAVAPVGVITSSLHETMYRDQIRGFYRYAG